MPQQETRKYATPRLPYLRRNKPLTVLDAYLIAERLTNAEFAERVRATRGHPSGPTHVTVSTWRRGCAVPAHDMRAIIEVVTAGRVTFDDWGSALKPVTS